MLNQELIRYNKPDTQTSHSQQLSYQGEYIWNSVQLPGTYHHQSDSKFLSNTLRRNVETGEITTFVPDTGISGYWLTPIPHLVINSNNIYEQGNLPPHQTDIKDARHGNWGWDFTPEQIGDIELGSDFTYEVGNDAFYQQQVLPMEKILFHGKVDPINQVMEINENQIAQFNLITGMYLSSGRNEVSVMTNGISEMRVSPDNVFSLYDVRPEYTTIYIVPTKLNRYNGNKTLAKVYSSRESSFENKWDVTSCEDTFGTLDEIGNKEEVENIIFDKAERVTYQNTGDMKGKYFLGDINVSENHFYDYYHNQTTTTDNGIFEKKDGALVPYNFSGKYSRHLKFGINNELNNVDLTINYNIEAPLLDSDGGLNLSVRSSESELENSDMPQHYFDEADIDKIKHENYNLRELNSLLS